VFYLFDYPYYIGNCLKFVIKEIKKYHLQEYMASNCFIIILEYMMLKKSKFSETGGLIPHPPYSPDLSPCDYWLSAFFLDWIIEVRILFFLTPV